MCYSFFSIISYRQFYLSASKRMTMILIITEWVTAKFGKELSYEQITLQMIKATKTVISTVILIVLNSLQLSIYL